MNTTTDAPAFVRYSFGKLVKARQARIALGRAHDAADDLCKCDGRRCAPDCGAEVAYRAWVDAGAEVAKWEDHYRETCAVWGPCAR
jgi:hypothetical protein